MAWQSPVAEGDALSSPVSAPGDAVDDDLIDMLNNVPPRRRRRRPPRLGDQESLPAMLSQDQADILNESYRSEEGRRNGSSTNSSNTNSARWRTRYRKSAYLLGSLARCRSTGNSSDGRYEAISMRFQPAEPRAKPSCLPHPLSQHPWGQPEVQRPRTLSQMMWRRGGGGGKPAGYNTSANKALHTSSMLQRPKSVDLSPSDQMLQVSSGLWHGRRFKDGFRV